MNPTDKLASDINDTIAGTVRCIALGVIALLALAALSNILEALT